MGRSGHLRRSRVPKLLLVLAIAGVAHADEWSQSYDRAKRMLEAGQAARAAPLLRALAEAAREKSEQGYLGGHLRLGIMTKLGHGVPQSDAEAHRLLLLAAEGGDPSGQYTLGTFLQFTPGYVSIPDAAAWYRRAAARGHAGAQFHLGCLLEDGHGVEEDLAEAARLYRLAAEQGHPGAQTNLGVATLHGRGVAASRSEAARWFRRAADQGQAEARAALEALAATPGGR